MPGAVLFLSSLSILSHSASKMLLSKSLYQILFISVWVHKFASIQEIRDLSLGCFYYIVLEKRNEFLLERLLGLCKADSYC